MRVLPPTTALPPRARVPVGQSTRTTFWAVELIALVTWGVTTPGTAAAGCAAATPPTPTVAASNRAGAIREVRDGVGVMGSSCVTGFGHSAGGGRDANGTV